MLIIYNKNLDANLNQALNYLSSNEIRYSKFGAFLFRRFFQEITGELEKSIEESDTDFKFYIDIFLKHNLFDYFEKALVMHKDPTVTVSNFSLFFIG